MVTNVPGYLPAKDMEVLLSYFADKAYDKLSFEDYQKNFKGKL
jgi:thioredoxin-related protein